MTFPSTTAPQATWIHYPYQPWWGVYPPPMPWFYPAPWHPWYYYPNPYYSVVTCSATSSDAQVFTTSAGDDLG